MVDHRQAGRKIMLAPGIGMRVPLVLAASNPTIFREA
jgi:hypothetical protein